MLGRLVNCDLTTPSTIEPVNRKRPSSESTYACIVQVRTVIAGVMSFFSHSRQDPRSRAQYLSVVTPLKLSIYGVEDPWSMVVYLPRPAV